MPGSEGGDRVHNFFDQEKFSLQHSQVMDGSRLVSNGFNWSGNQRQGGSPLNFNPEQSASDPDRGNLHRQSSLVHGSPFSPSTQRPNFIVNPHLMQHASLNGYGYDDHLLQAKHIQTNFMGMNRDPNQHHPFSRGLLDPGAQYVNGSEQYRDVRLEPTESPVNFDFLGSHQQMNTQQLGMMQSSPRQQSGLNERQLLQQQAMMRNLYEVQRQQQLQQQDNKQTNSLNILSIEQQRPKDHSASLNNTTPFQDGSNYSLMSQHGEGNKIWLQGAVSPIMQGTLNGVSFSTEQSASPHILGFAPQSADHSLYGFPISNTRGSSSHHHHRMEKPTPPSQHEPSESIPLPSNQYGTVIGQVSTPDRDFGSRYGLQRNDTLTNASSQGSYPRTTLEKLSQAETHQRISSMEFQGPQEGSLMNSKQKALTPTAFLQDAAPLDPTEEQFLFGSDDNIWDAFGKSSISRLDDHKMVEGSELQNPFPSMQSGSWSALMQSALAETCSDDTNNQEEWSGVAHSRKPVIAGQEPLAFISNIQKQRTLVTDGNLHIKPTLDAEHCLSTDRGKVTNSHSMQGLPLPSLSSSSDLNERFQSNLASKSNQQTSEGSRWFDHRNLKAHSEDNQIHNVSGHNPIAALNLKGPSGSWAQHGSSLNNVTNQAHSRSSPDGYMGSVPADGSPMRSTSNESTKHPLQDKQKTFMHEEMQKDKPAWAQNSFPNSPSYMGQLNPNSRVETDPTRHSTYDNLKARQNPPASKHFNHWKHVGSVPEVESENISRPQHPPEASPHVLDSSVNSSENEIQAGRLADYSKHENSSHLHKPNFWDKLNGNELKDTIMSGQSNPNVALGKQKVSDQVAGQSTGLRKFQYHPMGILDENTQAYFGVNHINKGQVMSSEQTLFAGGQRPKSPSQNEKGKRSNSHANMYKLSEASSVGLSMAHLSNTSFDNSGSHLLAKTSQSSQNMLELLNKADQSKENSAEASRNSSEQNMISDKPAAESPDASMSHLQQPQLAGSQGYGLQLGRPHPRFPAQIRGSLQSPSQAPSSLGLNSGQFVQRHSSATSQAELHDARSGFLGQSGNSVSLQEVQERSSASIASGSPTLRNKYQSQQSCNESKQPSSNMLADTTVSQLDYTSDMYGKASIMQSSVRSQFNAMGSNMNPVTSLSSSSQADKNIQSSIRPAQGSFHMGFPSSWTNVPNQQSSSQPNSFTSQSHMKASALPPIWTNEQNLTTREDESLGSASGAPNTVLTRTYSQEDQHAMENSSKCGVPEETCLEPKSANNIPGKDGVLSYGTGAHPNRETSETSVKPDTKPQNSYSLLHQLQVMRSTEIDPNIRDSKRLKVQGSSSDAQQSPSRYGQHQYSYSPTAPEPGNINLVISADYKLPKFTSVPSSNQVRYIPSQHGSVQYQNMSTLGRVDNQNYQNGSPVVSSMPLPQISPQMAPTWFERYGSFNREQLVPASDVWKHSFSRPPELAQTPENSSTSFLAQSQVDQILAPSVANQVGDMKHSLAPEPVVAEQSSSPQLTAPTAHGLVLVGPRTLETAKSELLPWCKKMTQHGLRDLPSIRASEVKWASATKRISEKVMDEVEHAEYRTVTLNGKRRLVLTTQLMQQLLEPPPASVMSSDAYVNYESVVYFTSRESCGSACSLSGSKNPLIISSDHNNMMYKKVPGQGDDLLSKVENNFLVRVSKLENALSSLQNQTSILELRTEWQDLEKFSVINRFAKFHGRGQADGPMTVHSSMNSQSQGPQRYVTALPSPRNLPDTVQCLSL
ncbi:hypothetical protein QQ045_030256 [Rhodiola kirilowii]